MQQLMTTKNIAEYSKESNDLTHRKTIKTPALPKIY